MSIIFTETSREASLDVLMKGQQWGYIDGIINPILVSKGCTWGIGMQQCLWAMGMWFQFLLTWPTLPLERQEKTYFTFYLQRSLVERGFLGVFLSIWNLPADVVFTLFNMFSPSLQPSNGILKAIWYHRFPHTVLLASVGSSVLKINGIIRFKVIKREQRDVEFSSCVPYDIGKTHYLQHTDHELGSAAHTSPKCPNFKTSYLLNKRS